MAAAVHEQHGPDGFAACYTEYGPFDAVQAAAQCPAFAELKRGRGDQLAFD